MATARLLSGLSGAKPCADGAKKYKAADAAAASVDSAGAIVREALDALRIEGCAAGAWNALWATNDNHPGYGCVYRLSGSARVRWSHETLLS